MSKTLGQASETKMVPAGTWTIDVAHSSVSFVARHLVVAKVRGRFTEFSGVVHVADTPEASWAEIEIRVDSIDTGTPARDDHLRTADFLDIEQHPTATFRSSGLEVTGDRTFRLAGDLTVRDVTRPVLLDVEFEGSVADPWGGTRAVFSATAELDREDWGITYNQALEAGGVLIGKRVRIEIEIEAVLDA